MTDGLKMYEEH
jgi:hypothetical protein